MRLSQSVACLLTAVWLVGCGGGSDATATAFSGAGQSQTTTISGRVLSEGGTPEAGVRVFVHERTTNAKGEAISAADGTFSLLVPAGVYDLLLDREGDSHTASCYFGPVEPAGAARDYLLHASAGRSAIAVFGKLWLTAGVPASNRKVSLNVAQALNEEVLPLSTSGRTQSDGTFELTCPTASQAGVDLEIFDGTESLDEWVDFRKLEKPAYLEFTSEQNPVENLEHAGQNPPPEDSVAVASPVKSNSRFRYDSRKSNGSRLVASGFLIPDGIESTLGQLIDLRYTSGPAEPVSQLFQQVATEGKVRRGEGDWGSRNVLYCQMPVPCMFSYLFYRTSATLDYERTFEAADYANFTIRTGGRWESASLPDNLDEHADQYLVLAVPR